MVCGCTFTLSCTVICGLSDCAFNCFESESELAPSVAVQLTAAPGLISTYCPAGLVLMFALEPLLVVAVQSTRALSPAIPACGVTDNVTPVTVGVGGGGGSTGVLPPPHAAMLNASAAYRTTRASEFILGWSGTLGRITRLASVHSRGNSQATGSVVRRCTLGRTSGHRGPCALVAEGKR